MARKLAKVRGVFEKNPGSGIWYVQYKENGVRVRKQIGTREAAINYLDKIRYIRSTEDGVVPKSAKGAAKTTQEKDREIGSVTVNELCDEWLTYIQARPAQYKDQRNPPYRVSLIKAEFGDRPAASVKPSEIRKWIDSFQDYAPATKNKLKANLSVVYRFAKENDRIDVNPARDVKREKISCGVIRYLKAEEEDRLRKVLQADIDATAERPQYQKHMIHRMLELTFSLGTGMRKGEQYGLRWPDVDFKRRSITVRDTKNGESRVVPMIDDVRDSLLALQALELTRKDQELPLA